MADDVSVTTELQGTIVAVFVEVGASVGAGDVLALVESMKMHHELVAPVSGMIDSLALGQGDTVAIGQEFARIAPGVRDVPGTSRTWQISLARVMRSEQ